MRMTEERLARLALLWSEAVGPAGLARLLAHFGSAVRILQASRGELAAPALRLRPEQVAAIAGLRRRLPQYEDAWREYERRYLHVLFPEDEAYPPPLREIANRPAVLTIYGNWLACDDPAVAIVGTRTPTAAGLAMAEQLALVAAAQGVTVVSGLAPGIDQAAHRGALRGGGRTIAVVGCGLLAINRRDTGGLEREIAGRGAVISELEPRAPASVPHLMARNRLTSGLARAVIVVQSRFRGGALVTADYAVRQGRVVAAVPWPEDLPEGAGTRQLLQQGALAIAGPADLEELVAQLRRCLAGPAPRPQQLPLFGQ
jgi:DNA processing protein